MKHIELKLIHTKERTVNLTAYANEDARQVAEDYIKANGGKLIAVYEDAIEIYRNEEQTNLTIYFVDPKTGHTTQVATFDDPAVYQLCIPALEAEAKRIGMELSETDHTN